MSEDENQSKQLKALSEEMVQILAPLDERERDIMLLRLGLHGSGPRTLEEVAEAFNFTRERIRQLEQKALAKLRHPKNQRESIRHFDDVADEISKLRDLNNDAGV